MKARLPEHPERGAHPQAALLIALLALGVGCGSGSGGPNRNDAGKDAAGSGGAPGDAAGSGGQAGGTHDSGAFDLSTDATDAPVDSGSDIGVDGPDLPVDAGETLDTGVDTLADAGDEDGGAPPQPCTGQGKLLWAVQVTQPANAQTADAWDVAVLADASIVVAGGLDTTRIFWARYDADGQLLATRTFSGSSVTSRSVAALPDGSFVMVGDFYYAMTFDRGLPTERTLTTPGVTDSDLFIAVIGADGNLRWVSQGTGPSDPMNSSVAVLPDGRIAMTGQGGVTFNAGGPGELTTPGMSLTLFSASGQPLWSRGISLTHGAGVSEVHSFRALADNSLALTGWFFSAASFEGSPGASLTGNSNRESLFLARYLDDGTLSFARMVSNRSMGMNVADGEHGELIVTGTADANAVFDPGGAHATSLPASGAFIARYSRSGDFLGAARSGTGYDDEAGLMRTSHGALVSVGTFYYQQTFGSPDGTQLTGLGWQDAYVACLSPLGRLGWVRQIGGTQNDFGTAIATLPDGDVIVTGRNRTTATASAGAADAIALPVLNSGSSFLARYRP